MMTSLMLFSSVSVLRNPLPSFDLSRLWYHLWLQGGCLGRKSTSHRSARYLHLLLDSWPKPVGRGRSDLAAERRLTPVSPTLSSPRRGCATCHLPIHNARPDTDAP